MGSWCRTPTYDLRGRGGKGAALTTVRVPLPAQPGLAPKRAGEEHSASVRRAPSTSWFRRLEAGNTFPLCLGRDDAIVHQNADNHCGELDGEAVWGSSFVGRTNEARSS